MLLIFFLLFNLIFIYCKSEDYWAEDYFSDESYEGGEFNRVDNVSPKKPPLRLLKSRRKYNHTCDAIIRSRLNEESAAAVTSTAVSPCKHQDYKNNADSDEETTLERYPFSVSIQRKGAHYATGALVSQRWILTSAAEFFNVRESIKLFRARLGSVDCKRGGTLAPINRLEIHPFYDHNKPSFDLAMLRMGIPANYTNVIMPIPLSKINGEVLSAKYLTTYWPRIVIKGQVIPKTARERMKYNSMRTSTQKLIPWNECARFMAGQNESLSKSSFCLKPIMPHHSVCMPDVGAPVIAQDGLWGITSSWVSKDCPSSPGPTVITRVSSSVVRSWLHAQL